MSFPRDISSCSFNSYHIFTPNLLIFSLYQCLKNSSGIQQIMKIQNSQNSNLVNLLKDQPQFQQFSVKQQSQSITNWSKTHLIGYTSQIIQIKTQKQLIQLIRNSKKKLRPFGSKLSYEPLCAQDKENILIDLKLTGVVSQTENIIEVYAGTQLSSLYEIILTKGKMLKACPGVISMQTVAGAISTGTHGQGIYQSTIADSILELTIINGKGNIRVIKRQDENFGAYLLTLGCLGIITRVKFELVENKIYRCQKFNTNFQYLLNSFQKLTTQKLQTKAWWFPWTDEVQIWQMEQASKQQEQIYINSEKQLLKVSEADRTLETTIDLVRNKMAKQTKNFEQNDKNLQVLTRFEVVNDVIGNIYQIMNKGIPIPQINCEISVNMVHFKVLLLKLHSWFQQHNHSLHYPFILRPTGKSNAWLSGTYDQISIHIGFLMYISEDGNVVKGSLDLLKQIEAILAQFGGRPHMGKMFSIQLYSFQQIYPKWEKFKQVMKIQDPEERFLNGFTRKLFKKSLKN